MPTKLLVSSLKGQLSSDKSKEATIICQIQHFEADFLWKVSLKILNSGIILKTFTNGLNNNQNDECASKDTDQPMFGFALAQR